MNLSRIGLIAILLMSFGYWANGQLPPKAVLMDEHGLLPCDDSLSRLDAWYTAITQDPNSLGLAVITARPEDKHLSVFRQAMMEYYAFFRGVSKKLRLKYIRANSSSDPIVKLWRIPAGADEPAVDDVDNTYKLPHDIKPFLLGEEYPDDPRIDFSCPGERSDQKIFASFLKGNPLARGNIVVRRGTPSETKAAASRILRTFKKKYDIPSYRLRFFPRTSRNLSNNLEAIVEYWYLP